MRCIAHCLHNAIKKACATPLIESDIKLLRTLCKEIKKSTILSGQLANLARANGKKKCKVVLDCKVALGVCIEDDTNDFKVEINQLDTGEVLHATTEAKLQELGDMLQDCINLIFFIEGSRYVTLSCVPFALYYLLQHLEPKRGGDASIAISRSTLRNYVVEKYPIYPVHYLVTYLDPRFKNLEPFVQPEEHAANLHDIAELLEDPIHT